MQDESIELLKILTNISSSIFYTRKSNVSRIEDQQFFDRGVEKFLQQSVIYPLDQSLDSLATQIASVLNIIPIYYKFLRNVEGLSMFDSAELICIIKDINRFKRFSNLLSYAGFTPKRTQYNKRLHKLLLKLSYKLSQNNLMYSFIYETAYENYKIKGNYKNEDHLINLAKRVVIKQFLKDLYLNWTMINESEWESLYEDNGYL